MTIIDAGPAEQIADTMALLGRHTLTLAVAESMTGGELALRLTQVAGSGEVFAGGLITYHSAAKRSLLEVPPGPVVSAQCAQAMASGVARLFQADIGLATTGVAGPIPQDDQRIGTVFLGWATAFDQGAQRYELFGRPPEDVRATAVDAALALLVDIVESGGLSPCGGADAIRVSEA